MSDEQATLGGGTVTVEEHSGSEACEWQKENGEMCGNSAALRVSLPEGDWLYACRVHAEPDWLSAIEDDE